jgi:hypothetical protein
MIRQRIIIGLAAIGAFTGSLKAQIPSLTGLGGRSQEMIMKAEPHPRYQSAAERILDQQTAKYDGTLITPIEIKVAEETGNHFADNEAAYEHGSTSNDGGIIFMGAAFYEQHKDHIAGIIAHELGHHIHLNIDAAAKGFETAFSSHRRPTFQFAQEREDFADSMAVILDGSRNITAYFRAEALLEQQELRDEIEQLVADQPRLQFINDGDVIRVDFQVESQREYQALERELRYEPLFTLIQQMLNCEIGTTEIQHISAEELQEKYHTDLYQDSKYDTFEERINFVQQINRGGRGRH